MRGLKIYETILKQTEAKKLTADPVNSRVAELINAEAEKAFKTQFKSVCHVVKEPIKVNSNGINSPFLKKLIEENKDSIAFVTTRQSGKNADSQPETKKQDANPAKPKTTELGD